jgi:hypothetical protein
MLAILIEHGQNEGQIKRVVLDRIDSGQSILQYVDDTILFMDHDLNKIKLSLILSAFELL